VGPLGVLFILPVLAVFRPRFSSVPFWRSSAGSSALRLACGAFPCGEILGSRERSKSQPLATIPRLGRGEHVRDCAQNDAPHRSKSLNPYRAG